MPSAISAMRVSMGRPLWSGVDPAGVLPTAEFDSTYVCTENWRPSILSAQHRAVKKRRTYTLGRRAEQQAATRQRIVEAAVDLHTRVGPARTTLSMIAEQAGLQRHTLYAHFPDERSLFLACSGLFAERNPAPDAQAWRGIGDPPARLRQGLAAIYAWYADNAEVLASVIRDAEHHALTRETAARQFGPLMAAYQEVLGDGLGPRQRAMLGLALSFHTWRTLVRDAGLAQHAAVDAMARAVCDQPQE
jgi:AcrR family transcriptional regulator